MSVILTFLGNCKEYCSYLVTIRKYRSHKKDWHIFTRKHFAQCKLVHALHIKRNSSFTKMFLKILFNTCIWQSFSAAVSSLHNTNTQIRIDKQAFTCVPSPFLLCTGAAVLWISGQNVHHSPWCSALHLQASMCSQSKPCFTAYWICFCSAVCYLQACFHQILFVGTRCII